jgi:transposase-like protein
MENQPPQSRVRAFFSKDERSQILKEHRDQGVPISVLARKYGMHPITLYQWKRKEVAMEDDELTPEQMRELLLENRKLKRELKTLKAKVGDLVVTNEILETAVDILKKRNMERLIEQAEKSKRSKDSK